MRGRTIENASSTTASGGGVHGTKDARENNVFPSRFMYVYVSPWYLEETQQIVVTGIDFLLLKRTPTSLLERNNRGGKRRALDTCSV